MGNVFRLFVGAAERGEGGGARLFRMGKGMGSSGEGLISYDEAGDGGLGVRSRCLVRGIIFVWTLFDRTPGGRRPGWSIGGGGRHK